MLTDSANPLRGGPLPTSSLRSKFVNLCPIDSETAALNNVATSFGASFLRLAPIADRELSRFVSKNAGKFQFKETLSALLASEKGQPGVAVARYDIEYGTWKFPRFQRALIDLLGNDSPQLAKIAGSYASDTNYDLDSPLLSRDGLRLVLGERRNIPSGLVTEVGCGNCQLLDKLKIEQGISSERFRGIDISEASTSLVRQRGIESFTGTLPMALQQRWLTPDSVGALFLSYFIDRDIDQRGTLQAAAAVLKPGGLLILEGLFPVNPFDSLGNAYAPDPSKLVTLGNSAAEDVRLVADTLQRQKLRLLRIVTGERLVFSLDGFEILPSTFLVCEKE